MGFILCLSPIHVRHSGSTCPTHNCYADSCSFCCSAAPPNLSGPCSDLLILCGTCSCNRRSGSSPASAGSRIMSFSKFYRLGAHTAKSLIKAPTLVQRSCFSVIHKQNFRPQRCELFSSTATKVDSEDGNDENKKINVTFVDKDGEEMHIKVPVGMSMLEAAHENDIDLEGACEGSLACSTCHVIVMDMEQYNKLSDPTDEENDMLDLAFGLTETSRLGCQIVAKPELEGLRLAIPAATRNFAVDGFKPKPH